MIFYYKPNFLSKHILFGTLCMVFRFKVPLSLRVREIGKKGACEEHTRATRATKRTVIFERSRIRRFYHYNSFLVILLQHIRPSRIQGEPKSTRKGRALSDDPASDNQVSAPFENCAFSSVIYLWFPLTFKLNLILFHTVLRSTIF